MFSGHLGENPYRPLAGGTEGTGRVRHEVQPRERPAVDPDVLAQELRKEVPVRIVTEVADLRRPAGGHRLLRPQTVERVVPEGPRPPGIERIRDNREVREVVVLRPGVAVIQERHRSRAGR